MGKVSQVYDDNVSVMMMRFFITNHQTWIAHSYARDLKVDFKIYFKTYCKKLKYKHFLVAGEVALC